MDIIVIKKDTGESNIKNIIKWLESKGFKSHISKGSERTIIGVIGDTSKVTEEDEISIKAIKGVENIVRILKPYKLASLEFKKTTSQISVNGNIIGGKKIQIIAGPCAVEGKKIILDIASKIKKTGVKFLRGGAFKPRTSPYSFQGLGEEGLIYLNEAKKKTGLLIVSEIMDPRDMDVIMKYTDIIQIGARNMQNFKLLLEVGSVDKPVLLKRGLSATIKEWLMSAEYIMSQGNQKIILCERGIRTFETATRNTLDLSAVPVLKQLTHLPVVVDPSHGVGKRDLVASMAKAAVAAGADGLVIEVHTNPEKAISDGEQTLSIEAFVKLVNELKPIAKAVGRQI